jgi:4-hydroxy-tetrahydrodipicolinate reductase
VTIGVVVAGGEGAWAEALLGPWRTIRSAELCASRWGRGRALRHSHSRIPRFHARSSAALAGADVLIDFTTPETVAAHARACCDGGVAWVLGTTGLDATQQALVDAAAGRFRLPGGQFFHRCDADAATGGTRGAPPWTDTDLEVIEAHHRHKVDAPSGTALAIGRAMAAARGTELDDDAV